MIVNEISLVIQNKNDIRKLMADKKNQELWMKNWFSGDIILFPDEYNSILIKIENPWLIHY